MKRIRAFIGLKNNTLTWLERVWLAAPVFIWFGYHPVISLGKDSTSYYELSLALLYLVVLGLVGTASIWRARKRLVKNRAVWLAAAFVGYSGLTLFWTMNPLRGLLTFGIISLLFLVLLAGLAEQKRLRALLRPLTTILILSASVVSVFAIGQMIAGLFLPAETTLLCRGCVAEQFGFVRPNVFAIEPQFLGSLLLAPLLVAIQQLLQNKRNRLLQGAVILMTTALVATLSRGAIFAFAIGLVVLFIVYRSSLSRILRAAGLLVSGCIVALLLQGTTAAANRTVDVTFMEAVSSSINQLTLGVVDIPTEQPSNESTDENEPAYDGYVEESTDVRLSMSSMAFGAWQATPARMLFGAGLGSAGLAMHDMYPETIGAREIVQNEYAELLLEYGIVGLSLFIALLVGVAYTLRAERWAWAIAAAYYVQWLFFSGYPNALHIYLTLIALVVFFEHDPHGSKQ